MPRCSNCPGNGFACSKSLPQVIRRWETWEVIVTAGQEIVLDDSVPLRGVREFKPQDLGVFLRLPRPFRIGNTATPVAAQLGQGLSQDLDDNFAIVIDPTLSHRNAYIFQVNPLGTQRDGEIIEEQVPPQTDSIVDPSWDGL